MHNKNIQDLSDYCKDDPIFQKARKIAALDKIHVLLTGETGTGKEVLAHHIHYNSPRADKPYITVNLASINGPLIRSQLFGHKKGAFSDAYKDNNGFIKEADGGTIFLDEIGDIDPDVQVAILRFLDSGEIMPVGANKPEYVNVRVIAATSADLRKKIANGEFKEDLYQRLCGIKLHLDPLRLKPKHEIKKSIENLIATAAMDNNTSEKHLTDSAWNALLNYEFKGNYRDAKNIVVRMYVEDKNTIDVQDIEKLIADYSDSPPSVPESIINDAIVSKPLTLREQNVIIAHNTVLMHNGVKKYAAEGLDIDFKTLNSLLSEYNAIGNITDASGKIPIGDWRKDNPNLQIH